MARIDEFLQELDMESQATRRVLQHVPQDQMNWRPHEKSMTLGQLAMHVAQLPGGIATIASQPSFDVGINIPRNSAKTTDELLTTLDKSVARAKELLSGMDDAALATPWRLVKGEKEIFTITRATLLRTIMLNHWYHHRGQLTVYLRQTGALVPAVFGSSADEQPF